MTRIHPNSLESTRINPNLSPQLLMYNETAVAQRAVAMAAALAWPTDALEIQARSGEIKRDVARCSRDV